jgi:hypothetical protein
VCRLQNESSKASFVDLVCSCRPSFWQGKACGGWLVFVRAPGCLASDGQSIRILLATVVEAKRQVLPQNSQHNCTIIQITPLSSPGRATRLELPLEASLGAGGMHGERELLLDEVSVVYLNERPDQHQDCGLACRAVQALTIADRCLTCRASSFSKMADRCITWHVGAADLDFCRCDVCCNQYQVRPGQSL